MAADVAGHFAAAGGVADQRGALDIQRVEHGGQVIGVGVHVVALGRLVRAAMATAVVGDHAEALLHQEQHLGVPGVGVERPAVREHHRTARTPVLVEDARAVLGRHEMALLRLAARGRCGLSYGGRQRGHRSHRCGGGAHRAADQQLAARGARLVQLFSVLLGDDVRHELFLQNLIQVI